MHRRLSVAVALVLACAAVRAAQAQAPFAESVIDVTLNGEHLPAPLVVRRDADGTLLLRAEDLKALRLKTPSTGAVMVNGQRYYRIGREIGANATFDDATQSVDLVLPTQAFVAATTRIASPDAPRAVTTQLGGFVNYDISVQRVAGVDTGGAIVESGVFGSKGVVTASALTRTGAGRSDGVRLDTTWTRDFTDRMTTLRIGDSISSTGSWGRAVRFGGVQYGTNFSTQPSFVTTPLLGAKGDAVLPSTVEVFVNGNPVASQNVQPGPFQIEGVPAVNGAGQVQVVVTDALGRQQVISQPYYAGSALLREGLSEYSVEAGAIRQDYSTKSNDYGNVVGAATYRRGITDSVTAEVHAEGEANGAGAAGADGAVKVGTFGIAKATAAVGGDGSSVGWLGGFGFEHNGPRFSAYARELYASQAFAQLGDEPAAVRMRSLTFGGLGFSLDRFGSLQFAYGRQANWGAPTTQTFGVGYSLGLGMLGNLNLFANYSDGGNSQTDVYLTWTLPLGERGSASTSLQHTSGGDAGQDGFAATATVQQNLPVGPGSGYVMSVSSAEDYHLSYAYQGHSGMVTADYARANGQDGLRVGAVGGMAITDTGVMASRRLEQGFAMVQVADYPGVEVFVDNQSAGRTDGKGRILLDRLLPYQANKVSIDPTALPMDATINAPAVTVTPAYRSGMSVRFPVSRADAITMRLIRADGQPVPAGATVMLEGNPFPVATDGVVYLTGVASNAHAAVTWRDGRCSVEFVRPTDGGPVPDLGDVSCR